MPSRWERTRRGWRWLALAGATAALVCLPALVAAVPAADRPVGAAALLARVRGSAAVPYQGYAESRAGLGLPDVPRAGAVVALLGETTRMRAWVAGPDRWRVDELTAIGERDLYRQPGGTWLWDSGERHAQQTVGQSTVRFPRPADLLPPELGRRLAAAAAPAEAARLPARRVAGVPALGLRLVPRDPDTTVGRVDLWADPRSGLPLRVELVARGARDPIVTTSFLDLRLAPPDPRLLAFRPPADAEVETTDAPDVASALDHFSPFVLPDQVGGRPRRTRVGGPAATYGQGFALVAALAFPDRFTRRTDEFLARVPVVRGPFGEASLVATPLLNGLVLSRNGVGYVLAGTVPPAVLERAATTLLHDGVGFR